MNARETGLKRKGEKNMKIAVKTQESVLVIDKSKKDWEMNGRKGTAYKAICHKKNGEEVQVDEIRLTENVYKDLKPMTRYFFEGEVDVKNGRLEVLLAHEDKGNPAK